MITNTKIVSKSLLMYNLGLHFVARKVLTKWESDKILEKLKENMLSKRDLHDLCLKAFSGTFFTIATKQKWSILCFDERGLFFSLVTRSLFNSNINLFPILQFDDFLTSEMDDASRQILTTSYTIDKDKLQVKTVEGNWTIARFALFDLYSSDIFFKKTDLAFDNVKIMTLLKDSCIHRMYLDAVPIATDAKQIIESLSEHNLPPPQLDIFKILNELTQKFANFEEIAPKSIKLLRENSFPNLKKDKNKDPSEKSEFAYETIYGKQLHDKELSEWGKEILDYITQKGQGPFAEVADDFDKHLEDLKTGKTEMFGKMVDKELLKEGETQEQIMQESLRIKKDAAEAILRKKEQEEKELEFEKQKELQRQENLKNDKFTDIFILKDENIDCSKELLQETHMINFIVKLKLFGPVNINKKEVEEILKIKYDNIEKECKIRKPGTIDEMSLILIKHRKELIDKTRKKETLINTKAAYIDVFITEHKELHRLKAVLSKIRDDFREIPRQEKERFQESRKLIDEYNHKIQVLHNFVASEAEYAYKNELAVMERDLPLGEKKIQILEHMIQLVEFRESLEDYFKTKRGSFSFLNTWDEQIFLDKMNKLRKLKEEILTLINNPLGTIEIPMPNYDPVQVEALIKSIPDLEFIPYTYFEELKRISVEKYEADKKVNKQLKKEKEIWDKRIKNGEKLEKFPKIPSVEEPLDLFEPSKFEPKSHEDFVIKEKNEFIQKQMDDYSDLYYKTKFYTEYISSKNLYTEVKDAPTLHEAVKEMLDMPRRDPAKGGWYLFFIYLLKKHLSPAIIKGLRQNNMYRSKEDLELYKEAFNQCKQVHSIYETRTLEEEQIEYFKKICVFLEDCFILEDFKYTGNIPSETFTTFKSEKNAYLLNMLEGEFNRYKFVTNVKDVYMQNMKEKLNSLAEDFQAVEDMKIKDNNKEKDRQIRRIEKTIEELETGLETYVNIPDNLDDDQATVLKQEKCKKGI